MAQSENLQNSGEKKTQSKRVKQTKKEVSSKEELVSQPKTKRGRKPSVKAESVSDESKEEKTVEKPSVEEESAFPKTINPQTSSNDPEDEKLSALMSKIDDYCSMRTDSFSGYSDWMIVFDEYDQILNSLDKYSRSIQQDDYSNAKSRIETKIGELDFYHTQFIAKYTSWSLRKGQEIEEKTNKHQILNFTVFSLFMTLLTFLLSNVIAVNKQDTLSLKRLILINLILLLVASVVFLFIGLFFGLVKKKSQFWFVVKNIILCLVPFAIAAAMLIVYFSEGC